MVRSVREWHQYKRKLMLVNSGKKGPLREFDHEAYKLIMFYARIGPPPPEQRIRWTGA